MDLCIGSLNGFWLESSVFLGSIRPSNFSFSDGIRSSAIVSGGVSCAPVLYRGGTKSSAVPLVVGTYSSTLCAGG